jgi:uncharacterized membrane protein
MPNVHPLLVHFPIALLLAATAVDLGHAARPDRATLRDTATWLYCAGASMAMAAYFSGLTAAGGLRVAEDVWPAVTAHFTWAERTTWFFVFFASFRMAVSFIWRSTRRRTALISSMVALVGVLLLLATADRGGRLVFRHGLGVASVPADGRPWTIQEADTPAAATPTRPGSP